MRGGAEVGAPGGARADLRRRNVSSISRSLEPRFVTVTTGGISAFVFPVDTTIVSLVEMEAVAARELGVVLRVRRPRSCRLSTPLGW